MPDMDDMVRDGKWMDTHDMRGSGYGFYSSSSLDMHHGHHRYHH